MTGKDLSSAEALARACDYLEHVDPEDIQGYESLTKHGIELLFEANEAENE